ncbi:MAG: slipin family protein [Anaerolineae bacterium]|nr:slipin family protein [Anaerolineae bacterium]
MNPNEVQLLSQYVPYLIGLIVLLFVLRAVRVAQEYERAVIFSFGRVTRRPRGPGLYVIWPWERSLKVDIRINTLAIQPQDCITNDNVTVRVDAVAYFHVSNPIKATVNVRDYMQATLQIAQTTLRSVIGQVELDQLLAHRNEINMRVREIIDKQTETWGIEVSVVEVKDIELPEMMQRAMARQAEAEREKRAKIIHAQGEYQAAEQLQQAAATMAREPAALQLRYLQTLTEIASEKNSTIIFPMPVDLIQAFKSMLDRVGEPEAEQGSNNRTVVRPRIEQ